MTKSRNYTWISLLVLMALAFALLFAFAVAPAQANAEPTTHTHDDITFTAWESTTSLPGSAGSYYLTADVTLSGTWTMPSGGVNLCLNGYGIKTTSGRVITINGGTLNLYDCGTATHYFDVSDGKAVNVNTTSGAKSFTGGYITGGSGQAGLSYTAYYWGEGGGILVWSGTFNMYGGTILGNSAASGGGVEVVNATMNMYGGSISYNGGVGVNLRATGPAVGASEKGTATLNMYGGSISYNKGIGVHDSYGWYGNRAFNLYGGSISHNTSHGIWVESTTNITGDPTIEGNGGNGVLAHTLTLEGSPVIRDNGSGDFRVASDKKIVITDALNCQPMSVFMHNDATGVFTSGWSEHMSDDPTTYFYAYNSDEYHVENEEGEAKMVEGGVPVTIYVHNLLQGTTEEFSVYRTATVAAIKASAAALFGIEDETKYKLTFDGETMTETDTLKQCGVQAGDSLTLIPVATYDGLKTLTLVPSVTSTATAAREGVYTAIHQGDTITITYASTQNSGFVEALFTTAFNEEYFHLTSVSVDGNAGYTLFNDYGREVGDEYVPMTLAQHIADHNASLDNGEEPYTGRLSFHVSYSALRDTTGSLSDHFLTVTYTAVQDIPAGEEFAFGFDMSLDGMFTNAAYDDEELLLIIDDEGKAADEEMVILVVKNVTAVTIPEDQTLTFKRSNNSYIVDATDVEITWIAPEFTAPAANPYITAGGVVTYTFYTKDGDEYLPIVGVPTAVGDYYVKATLTETNAYLGYETDYVAISVAKILVDVPELKLYDDEESETPTYAEGSLTITMDDVVYGSTLTLKETVETVENVYGFENQNLSYVFSKDNGESWDNVSNFFNSQPIPVGSYKLTIAPKDSAYVAFNADPAVDEIVVEIMIVKAVVTAPTETTETYTYNGTEQTYIFATAGDSALYNVVGDKMTNAGSQTVTVTLKDAANYKWADDKDPTFTFTILKKALTIKTYINGQTEVALTYGDAAPNENAFTYVVEGIVAAEADDINAALLPLLAITAVTNDYEQYAGVGEYEYTTVAGDENFPSNYEIGTVENAKIVVAAKALTLSAVYEGGTVTLSYSGTVNEEVITVTYSVKDVDLAQNTYTAVAADVSASLVAKVTPSSANYAAAELTLKAVHAVTFEVTEAFTGAQGMPAAQYIFDGCSATEPADPTYDKYLFLYWTLLSAEYDFSSEVTADIVLVAAWEKDLYKYRFYAMYAGAEYALESYRCLAWNAGDAKFELAQESAVYEFARGEAISMNATVGDFIVDHWVKAVKVEDEYVYTTVETFESAVSTEVDEDAYYIAVMTLNIGMGDINGDGSVDADDIVMMKKFLVGVKYTTLKNVAAVWAKIGEPAPAAGYLYVFLWDANGDGYKDTRDVIAARMALATGYEYEIRSEVTVNGTYYSNEIVVTDEDSVFEGRGGVLVDDEESLLAVLSAGKKAFVTADITITDEEDPSDVRLYDVEEGDIYIDLGGHTLTVGNFQLKAKHGSVTVKNGYLGFKFAEGQIIFASETGVTFDGVRHAVTDYEFSTTPEDTNVAIAAE